MPSSVSIDSVVCVNPVTLEYTVSGSASDATKVAGELRAIDGQTGLAIVIPLMVMVVGPTKWTAPFDINPANSNYVVVAQLHDGTLPPPTDQEDVPPCS